MKTTTVLAIIVCVMAVANTASADTFGSGGNLFSIDFVPISGSTNPATGIPAGIGFTFMGVTNDYRMGTYEVSNAQWTKFKAAYGAVFPPAGPVVSDVVVPTMADRRPQARQRPMPVTTSLPTSTVLVRNAVTQRPATLPSSRTPADRRVMSFVSTTSSAASVAGWTSEDEAPQGPPPDGNRRTKRP